MCYFCASRHKNIVIKFLCGVILSLRLPALLSAFGVNGSQISPAGRSACLHRFLFWKSAFMRKAVSVFPNRIWPLCIRRITPNVGTLDFVTRAAAAIEMGKKPTDEGVGALGGFRCCRCCGAQETAHLSLLCIMPVNGLCYCAHC